MTTILPRTAKNSVLSNVLSLGSTEPKLDQPPAWFGRTKLIADNSKLGSEPDDACLVAPGPAWFSRTKLIGDTLLKIMFHAALKINGVKFGPRIRNRVKSATMLKCNFK